MCGFTSGRAVPVEEREVKSVVGLAREDTESTRGPSTAMVLSWEVCGPVIPETH